MAYKKNSTVSNKLTIDECEKIFFSDVQAFLEEVHYINGRTVVDEDPMLYVEMKSGELVNLRRNLHNKLAAYFYDRTQKYVDCGITSELVDHSKTRALSKTCGQKAVLVKRTFRVGSKVYFNPAKGDGKLYRIDKEGIIYDKFKQVKAAGDPVSAPVDFIDTDISETEFIPLLKKIFRIDEDVIRLLALYIIAVTLNVTVPILVITGAQGSGKTVLGSSIKYLYDPTLEASNVCSMPEKVDDAAVIMNASRMEVFDNLTDQPKTDMIDLICRSYSGGTHKKRRLFSDFNVSSLNVFCATIFTAIEQPFKRDDMISRIIEIRTTRFEDGERLKPDTIKRRIDRLRPKLYGAMFSAIQKYFALYGPQDEEEENSNTPSVVRVADFYELGCNLLCILDPALSSADFDAVIKSNQRRSRQTFALEDPVIHTLNSILDKSGGYLKITCGDLLKKIAKEASLNNLKAKIPDYPQQLSSYLKNNKDLLDSLGITICKCYSHNDKLLEIKKELAVNPGAPSSVSAVASNPVYTEEGIEEVTLEQLADNEDVSIKADDEGYCEDTDSEEFLNIEFEEEEINVEIEDYEEYEDYEEVEVPVAGTEYFEEEPHKYFDSLAMLDEEAKVLFDKSPIFY